MSSPKFVDIVSLPRLVQAEIDGLGGSFIGGEMLYNATNNYAMVHDGTTWSPIGGFDPTADKVISSLSGYIAGGVEANTVIATHEFDVETLFKTNLADSVVKCLTAPTAPIVFQIDKVETNQTLTSAGTITFAANAKQGTFVFASDLTLVAGEGLRLTSPVATEGMARMFFNIRGESLLPLAS